MAQSINTRIILRNDELSAFESSSNKLLKGEMALARSGGNYIVRIGTGDKTWKELSAEGQLIIPVENVSGLTAAIAALSTSYYETSAISNLSGTYVNGDIAVEKKTISGDKVEYTAYRYSTKVSAWQALDGNYSAENVYFPNDMTFTYAFGKYTVPSSGSYTLSCAGKSVKDVLNAAFAEAKSGTVTQPSFTLTVNGGTGEIGTNYTVPAATFKFTDDGNYQYGPATGVTVPVGQATLCCTTAGSIQTVSNTGVMTQGSTIQTAAGAANAKTYLSIATSYAFSGTAFYTQGAVPKNNIGADDELKRIAAGSQTKTADATFTGYYPAYWAFTSTSKSAPTSLTATNGNVTVDGVTYTRELNSFGKTQFTSNSNWYQLFYLVPKAKRSSSGWSGVDSNNIPLPTEPRKEATVTFKDGTTAEYYVYSISNAAAYQGTTCRMTFA